MGLLDQFSAVSGSAAIIPAIGSMLRFIPEPTSEQLIDIGIWFCTQMLDKDGKSNG